MSQTDDRLSRGLDIARAYYGEYGEPMLSEKFPDAVGKLACGLCGAGSECFGYDDALSRDHDFEPGFCIFIPGEELLDRKTAFLIEREYSRLPREFAGLKRTPLKPAGGARHGVIATADFYAARVGKPDGKLSLSEWLSLPEYSLAEATNGEVFFDGLGEFTAARERLSRYPEDVRRKKLAGRLFLCAQAGQYNYSRCLAHGETAAAQTALFEFADSAQAAVFLLNGVYRPYYKWSYRAMRSLPKLPALADTLEFLVTSDNSPANAEIKKTAVEDVCSLIAAEVEAQNVASADSELERLAYAVNDTVADHGLRNLHVLAGI